MAKGLQQFLASRLIDSLEKRDANRVIKRINRPITPSIPEDATCPKSEI